MTTIDFLPIHLAVDLAWTGPSGWAEWDPNNPTDPFLKFGEFKHKETAWQWVADAHYRYWTKLLRQLKHDKLQHVVCEIPDWHQEGSDPAAFARERVVRETLGAARAIFCLAAHHQGFNPVALGVNEARQQFGSRTKEGVRDLLLQEYPHVFADAPGWLFHRGMGLQLTPNITDAICLARVHSDNLRLERLANG